MPVRRRKLLVGLVLAAVLVVAIAVPASAAWFPDTEDHPYEASILALADRGIIGGYTNGNFGPDDPVIRQQFAKMIVLTLALPVAEEDFPDPAVPFIDLDTDDPAKLYPHEYVAVCALNNITKGTDATHFSPTKNITRQQVITMVVRAVDNLKPGTLEAVPAGWNGVLPAGDPTHGLNIKKAEYNGLLDGIWASTTVPTPGLAGWDTTKNATRGEVAEMLAQLLYRAGTVLTVTGPSGTQELTMDDIKALPAVEGYGGYKNRLDNVTGPLIWKGVSVQTLMGMVGGGTKVTVVASDGWKLEFDAVTYSDDVYGAFEMYNPATGATITEIEGEITMILAYSMDGGPLPSEDGALRIAFVSPNDDQVTWSGRWVSQVARIEVE
jgi:hypothetical protein